MTTSADTSTVDLAKSKPRLRLEFLDGLRGIAAIYVVLFHAIYFAHDQLTTPALRMIAFVIGYGHFAVDVFIVLSGYCLMMPVVRRTDRTNGSFVEYIQRRGKRIIPPYYAALALSVLCVFVAGRFGQLRSNQLKDLISPGILLSHIFLVHNLRFDWVYRINAPMWSVATEWQIYFLFPLLLLPIWRKLGNLAAIIAGLAIGLLPFYCLPADRNFWWAIPWFPGLFAMGMAGAAINFMPASSTQFWRRFVTSGWTPCSFLLLMVILSVSRFPSPLWLSDVLVGGMAASLITYCSAFEMNGHDRTKEPLVLRILKCRWSVKLGTFSYSLYLIHNPIQTAMLKLVQKHVMSIEGVIAFQVFVGVPIILFIAYLFHLCFERPFMSSSNGNRTRPGSKSQKIAN